MTIKKIKCIQKSNIDQYYCSEYYFDNNKPLKCDVIHGIRMVFGSNGFYIPIDIVKSQIDKFISDDNIPVDKIIVKMVIAMLIEYIDNINVSISK